MKLIVNVGALRHPLTGVGRYVLNLLQLVNQNTEVEDLVGVTLTGFLQRDQLARLMRDLDNTQPGKTGLLVQGVRWLGQQPWARYLQRRWIEFVVCLRRRAYKDYVYWETNNDILPFHCPVVSTVYDLSFLAHPEFHPQTRVAELSRRFPAYIRQSRRLISISQFTRQQLLHHYQPAVPVDVVPPAVADEYFLLTDLQKQAVRTRLQLPPQYLLAVSTLEPRKNLGRLLTAYSRLPVKLQRQFPLLLAGSQGWLAQDLTDIVMALQQSGSVRYLGYVDQRDLPALVAQASLNVYISLYEGYGMPIAESMAVGTPVLCSSVTSMPEVAMDSCFMVNPFNVDDISESIKMLLESESLRLSKVAMAKQIASTYTWAASSNMLISSLKKAS